MAKKKKKEKKIVPPKKKFDFSLPEKTKRYLFASLSFLLAIIFAFSFSGNAGTVGETLKKAFSFLIGNVIYIFPVVFIILGIILLKGGKDFRKNRNSIIISALILTLGLSGFLTLLNPELKEAFVWNKSLEGGWIGYLISWPILKGLDYIVSYCLFSVAILISLWIIIQPFRRKIKEKEEEEGEIKVEVAKKPSFDLSKFVPVKVEKPKEVKNEEETFKPFEQKKQKDEEYKYPPINLLSKKEDHPEGGDISYNSSIIKRTLQTFGIPVEMSEVNVGPTVTQYTLKPAEGIKLSKITALQNDLALALASPTIRIEAPIPGRSLVGIEIGNKKRAVVSLREVLDTDEFKNSPSPLLMALGKDVKGAPTFADLAEMPHLLIGGTTGSGKTICLNSIILSLLYRNSPNEMQLILVDPKRVEFPVYSGLEHLLCPVIYDANQTLVALKWLVGEMERRFTIFAEAHSRDIASYNQKMQKKGENKLPYIVLIIDELADLMSIKGKEIESYVVRLAQMSRATGIHLILATQRPSVEVITGLIKANITSRIALKVGSLVDSRTILDSSGAEKLLGKGDLLFLSKEFTKPKRIQNPFISENEIKRVINWIVDSNFTGKEEPEPLIETEPEDNSLINELNRAEESPEVQMDSFYSKEDPMYEEAKRIVISSKKASTSLLQRRLGIGYARAARLMDILEERGIVGPQEGAKPREVFLSEEDNY